MATQVPLLRVLCLHDGASTARELKEQFHLLGEKLYQSHSIDLVYVNSPITTTEEDEDEPSCYEQRGNDSIPRTWWVEKPKCPESAVAARATPDSTTRVWDCDDDDIAPNEAEATATLPLPVVQYHGLDASLMLLRQIWTSCPFWGIIGVGQGAAVASLLLAVLDHDNHNLFEEVNDDNDQVDEVSAVSSSRRLTSLPLFAVFVSGEAIVPVDEPLMMSTVPVLHLVDFDPEHVDDSGLDQQQQQQQHHNPQRRLIRQFPNGSAEQRRRQRRLPHVSAGVHDDTKSRQQHLVDPADLNRIGRFVIDRKKDLLGSSFQTNSTSSNAFADGIIGNRDCDVLALQTALHVAEQDAADCLAQCIALDPPPALMAVIRPSAVVAGWEGNRRRMPGEEGGGAPCPSEFLLHKQQRGNKASSSSSSVDDTGYDGPSRVHPEHDRSNGR